MRSRAISRPAGNCSGKHNGAFHQVPWGISKASGGTRSGTLRRHFGERSPECELSQSSVLGHCALFGLGAIVGGQNHDARRHRAGRQRRLRRVSSAVPVVVDKGPLKFGIFVDSAKVEVLNLPSNAVPEGAFTTVAQVSDAGQRREASGRMTPIAARKAAPADPSFPGPGARASVAAEIGDGLQAPYTIKVSDVTGAGGHALPGDRVDVVLMRDLTPEGAILAHVSDVVIQNVRVLGMDLNADLASNKPATPNNRNPRGFGPRRLEARRRRRPGQALPGAAKDRRGRSRPDRADARRQLRGRRNWRTRAPGSRAHRPRAVIVRRTAPDLLVESGGAGPGPQVPRRQLKPAARAASRARAGRPGRRAPTSGSTLTGSAQHEFPGVP